MNNCIFCKIIKGEIPSHKIYEDAQVFAFLDINPLNKGHTLIIPKKHTKDIFDIDHEDAQAIMSAAKKVAPALISSLGAQGINLLNSNGKDAGQVIFHYHMHVIPRYHEDGVRLFTPTRKHENNLEEIAEKIRSTL